MTEYKVLEGKTGGKVEVFDDRIVCVMRTRKGKQSQTIPMAGITSVTHQHKMMGVDVVSVQAGLSSFEWKCGKGAELAAEIQQKLI